MFCPNCGNKIKNIDKTCPSCGNKRLPQDVNGLRLASNYRRFLNFVIDRIAIIITTFFIGIIIGLFDNSASSLIVIIFNLLYYLLPESLWGRTLGKIITKTKVVAITGGKPNSSQIVKRTLIRFIPFDLLTFFGLCPVGWHDRWSNTRVIIDE